MNIKVFLSLFISKGRTIKLWESTEQNAIFLNYQLYLWPRVTSNLHEIIIRSLIPSKLEHLSVVLIKNGTKKTRVEWKFGGNLRDI